MGWYIGERLAAALVTVWIVATAGFLLVEIIPGDPARQLAGPGASAETLAASARPTASTTRCRCATSTRWRAWPRATSATASPRPSR